MVRGQVAIEFSVMIMLAFIFMITLLVIVAVYATHFQEQKQLRAMEDLADQLHQELLLAAAVEDGYERVIEIPDRLRGSPYTLSITNAILTLHIAGGATYAKVIPPVTGEFVIGTNRIRKANGQITIDQP